MAATTYERLHAQINELLALELALSQLLEAREDQATDADAKAHYSHHLGVTREHVDALRTELVRLGGKVDEGKTAFAGIGANLKGVLDTFRDSETRQLHDMRDDFVSEQTEIAGYMVLESMAGAANDTVLAQLARQHREQEEPMAAWLWHELQRVGRAEIATTLA